MHVFYHCVSTVTVLLWQKVDLANNHLTFWDKMDVILFENNLSSNHILLGTVCKPFLNEWLITKGTIFIGLPGILVAILLLIFTEKIPTN